MSKTGVLPSRRTGRARRLSLSSVARAIGALESEGVPSGVKMNVAPTIDVRVSACPMIGETWIVVLWTGGPRTVDRVIGAVYQKTARENSLRLVSPNRATGRTKSGDAV